MVFLFVVRKGFLIGFSKILNFDCVTERKRETVLTEKMIIPNKNFTQLYPYKNFTHTHTLSIL